MQNFLRSASTNCSKNSLFSWFVMHFLYSSLNAWRCSSSRLCCAVSFRHHGIFWRGIKSILSVLRTYGFFLFFPFFWVLSVPCGFLMNKNEREPKEIKKETPAWRSQPSKNFSPASKLVDLKWFAMVQVFIYRPVPVPFAVERPDTLQGVIV